MATHSTLFDLDKASLSSTIWTTLFTDHLVNMKQILTKRFVYWINLVQFMYYSLQTTKYIWEVNRTKKIIYNVFDKNILTIIKFIIFKYKNYTSITNSHNHFDLYNIVNHWFGQKVSGWTA